jgi:hypothetical protein
MTGTSPTSATSRHRAARPVLAAAFASTILLATSSNPAMADISDRWGAIAYGPGGVYGTARLLRTAAEAATAARQACGDRCTGVITFLRQCAAFASGKGGTISVARGRYLVRVQAEVLRNCRTKDTKCTVRVTVCTHRP